MLNKKPHSKLWLYFTGIIFATVTAAFLLITLFFLALFKLHIISIDPRIRHIPLLAFLAFSMLIGCTIAFSVGRQIIRPLQKMGAAFDELSKGNFSVRIPENHRIEEMREMAEHFNLMVCDLSRIETLQNDFVVNVSHEFKTPISSIAGYATLLQNHSLSAEKRDHYIEKILDNSGKLSVLCSSILMLSRLENQETVMHKKPYRLDEQIRRCILLFEARWTQKNIEFDISLPRQLFCGNEQLMEQVWSNIIDNAIKHSPDNGVIRVSLAKTRTHLAVTIADQGAGIAPEVQRHIFEKFYQGDSSRKADGNGLGLALVKRIVDLCQGTVSVKSAPGSGAAFTVTLPLEEG
ncbi:ATPase/histidine kinase/DNA gyrase B/HSP90 domain protein [Marvinbryantia formatexigens DSM 14469]|uniref:Heme sensor protein HssS n=1 Tax=Marvinbryantia formatexigens DSM 14469 TaxID=478749 RepID=C6LFN4_9FIRM|nr:HAMP domain-containing sensor histidine kinase [Marvinbryantia formatexigens]EET60619.1 ATPase/histidine kinase/DNA gyrase B/HSP90 domain protein [Marvinbryantia formatexigens DSM 14469]UWO25606.1 HAMP domain-containing histidine kinase [Marvinbryantia formatexigens DSM 14469]SDG17818.1 Signal transduction histidine kinase [Marvinbryantia formatexigens]